MPDEAVLLRRQDRVVTLLLHRPRIMNAMNEALVQSLKDALDKASADPGIHVVVLEGAGGNFSSGADFSLLDTPQEAGFGSIPYSATGTAKTAAPGTPCGPSWFCPSGHRREPGILFAHPG